jgi:hypothetical protein
VIYHRDREVSKEKCQAINWKPVGSCFPNFSILFPRKWFVQTGREALAACLSNVMQVGSHSKVTMLLAAIANEHWAHLKTSRTSHESISEIFQV